MEQGLKQRLVGAAALAALAVVFLPMVFDDTGVSEDVSSGPWDSAASPGGQRAPVRAPERGRDQAWRAPAPITDRLDSPMLPVRQETPAGPRSRPRPRRQRLPRPHPRRLRRLPTPGRSPRRPRVSPSARQTQRRRAPEKTRRPAIESAPPGRSNSGASAARPTPRSYTIACRSSAFSRS